jgi:hypothetical protein
MYFDGCIDVSVEHFQDVRQYFISNEKIRKNFFYKIISEACIDVSEERLQDIRQSPISLMRKLEKNLQNYF